MNNKGEGSNIGCGPILTLIGLGLMVFSILNYIAEIAAWWGKDSTEHKFVVKPVYHLSNEPEVLILWMVVPLLWPCLNCSIMVLPAMTNFLSWNKRASTTRAPLLYVEQWSVVVSWFDFNYRQNDGCWWYSWSQKSEIPTPLSERHWTFLILRPVELLPIWIMFIDRIIDRIWISLVTLTTEFFQP